MVEISRKFFTAVTQLQHITASQIRIAARGIRCAYERRGVMMVFCIADILYKLARARARMCSNKVLGAVSRRAAPLYRNCYSYT